MAARARSVLLRTAFAVLVTVGLVFGLLEASARVYLFGASGLIPSRINSVRGLHQTGFLQPAPEPRLGWELRPNVRGYFKLVPFETNSRGLRDVEYPLAKLAGTFRVAVLGASFAMPAGVAIEDAFHSRLEQQLTRESGSLRYEFLNFAVGMYSPEQVLAALELRALDYDPDLILFTTTRVSEPVLLAPPRARASWKELEGASLPIFQRSYPVLQSFALRLLRFRLGLLPERDAPVGGLERAWIAIASRFSPEAQPLDFTRENAPAPAKPELPVLDRLARVQARTGVPIVVVRLEFDPGVEERWVRRTAKTAAARCRELSLLCHDTRSAFEGSDPRDFWIHPLDPHPDARAHERFARSIGQFLEQHGLLGPGRRSPG